MYVFIWSIENSFDDSQIGWSIYLGNFTFICNIFHLVEFVFEFFVIYFGSFYID